MKRFNNFIYECLYIIVEDKADDLIKKNPNLSNEIKKYKDADPSPTKKFLPWLVKQHKLGNVTPDHSNLNSTLSNFDRLKSKHGIQDHTQHSFGDVADVVSKHLGKTKTDIKKKAKSDVDVIHNEDGVTAQHIKTKEASQELYGGGEERGGEKGGARGTTWCVSARSDQCAFGHYGHMYTIHDKNDKNAPYAVHPKNGTITSRHNDGDKDIDDVVRKSPKLKKAVDKIDAHYKNKINKEREFANKLNDPNVSKEHLDKALEHENPAIRKAAVKHKNASDDHIDKALNDENLDVRVAAFHKTNNVKGRHIDKGLKDKRIPVRVAAIEHPNTTKEHLDKALNDDTVDVRYAAIGHPNATKEHLDKGLKDENSYNRARVFSLGTNATKEHIDKGLKDPSKIVRMTALKHKNATEEHLKTALKDEDDDVQFAALRKYSQLKVARNQKLRNQVNEDVPVNNVGGGAIAGVGVGEDGEPGVKKKKTFNVLKKMLRRNLKHD